MSKKKDELAKQEKSQMEVQRIRLPKGLETIGLIEQRLGATRTRIRCLDGKERICRIPGRLKRRLWLREGDVVIVIPWEFGGDKKGDVLFKYRPLQVKYLREKGYLRKLDEFDEF